MTPSSWNARAASRLACHPLVGGPLRIAGAGGDIAYLAPADALLAGGGDLRVRLRCERIAIT
jgi:hypothetical protein